MTDTCAVRHPEDPKILCSRREWPGASSHPHHTGFNLVTWEWVDWPNDSFVPSAAQYQQDMRQRLKSITKTIKNNKESQ